MAFQIQLLNGIIVSPINESTAKGSTQLLATGTNTLGVAAFAVLLLCIGLMAILVSRHDLDEIEIDLREVPRKREDYLHINETPSRKYSARK